MCWTLSWGVLYRHWSPPTLRPCHDDQWLQLPTTATTGQSHYLLISRSQLSIIKPSEHSPSNKLFVSIAVTSKSRLESTRYINSFPRWITNSSRSVQLHQRLSPLPQDCTVVVSTDTNITNIWDVYIHAQLEKLIELLLRCLNASIHRPNMQPAAHIVRGNRNASPLKADDSSRFSLTIMIQIHPNFTFHIAYFRITRSG